MTASELADLCVEYYSVPGNEAGGNLHLVLDDGNLRDADVRFCLHEATKENDRKGADIARNFLKLRMAARREAVNLCHERIKTPR